MRVVVAPPLPPAQAIVTHEVQPETSSRSVPEATPIPVRDAVCGLPEALSVTVKVPVRVPVAVGVKVTLIAQFAPAARLEPQLLVCA